MPSHYYPIESDPGNMHVGRTQRSGHGSVGVHQPASQASLHARVNSGPGDGGSVQLETLRQQHRDVSGRAGEAGACLCVHTHRTGSCEGVSS